MNRDLYEMIHKRKSFHLFQNIGKGKISSQELEDILGAYDTFTSLCPDVKTAIKIVPANETSCKRGQEYCILLYSEKKDNYMANIGYLGQQLDLYLVSKNIGTLWFGMGKPEEASWNDLDFVIMIAISKVDDDKKFRKDLFKSKRKPVDEIWFGEPIDGVSDIVRFAPSACNTQPWMVERNGNVLEVSRYKKAGKWGIMPAAMVNYYNRIDIGIFLCFLDLCLEHQQRDYQRQLFVDEGTDAEKTLIARYTLE